MVTPAGLRIAGEKVCWRCLTRAVRPSSQRTLFRSSIYTKRKLHGGIIPDEKTQKNMTVSSQGFMHNYFSANDSIDRGWIHNAILATFRTQVEHKSHHKVDNISAADENSTALHVEQPTIQDIALPQSNIIENIETQPDSHPISIPAAPIAETVAEVLPHRRKRKQREALASNAGQPQVEESLPLDASSQLTTAATSLPTSATIRRRLATYLSLTKPRLSFLILLTTTSAYSLYPIPDILSSTNSAVEVSTLSTSTLTLLFLTTGTFLSCACANTLNMLFEPKYDALMTRTRNRPLVRGLISSKAAAAFALLCGTSGLLLLYFGTNPTVAGLSAFNIFMYAGVYTPMKRLSAANTWAGAIVGGIPPLMGWCAAAGQAATSEHHSWQDLLFSESSAGGWFLAALLFAWQFPHFMSLSHTIRDDYRNAGHKMLAWTNPARNARVALRYSIAMFPICAGLYWAGIVNEGFLAVSTACNLWMTREAVRFWRKQGAGGSARGLFWASVWQLPLVLVGALVCKRRIWDGFFNKDPEEVTSIYEEENNRDRDGETLGMAMSSSTHGQGNISKDTRDINLAMLGFKRPS